MHFTRSVCAAFSIAAFAASCASGAAPAPSHPTSPAGVSEYENVSFKVLLMTKPSGKYVRTAGAWGDVQPNVPGIPADSFGVYFYDQASILVLAVPKTFADTAAAFTHGQAVTVEGRFQDGPLPTILVDHFVEVTP